MSSPLRHGNSAARRVAGALRPQYYAALILCFRDHDRRAACIAELADLDRESSASMAGEELHANVVLDQKLSQFSKVKLWALQIAVWSARRPDNPVADVLVERQRAIAGKLT